MMHVKFNEFEQRSRSRMSEMEDNLPTQLVEFSLLLLFRAVS